MQFLKMVVKLIHLYHTSRAAIPENLVYLVYLLASIWADEPTRFFFFFLSFPVSQFEVVLADSIERLNPTSRTKLSFKN